MDGGWKVRGTDRGMSFQEVAAQAYTVHNYPDGVEPGLEFTSFFDPENFTFPFGTQHRRRQGRRRHRPGEAQALRGGRRTSAG